MHRSHARFPPPLQLTSFLSFLASYLPTDPLVNKEKRDLTNHVSQGGDERIRTAGAAFAEPCLTTWRRRRLNFRKGSGRRGSNPRLSPWQGDALPLSHSRITRVFA